MELYVGRVVKKCYICHIGYCKQMINNNNYTTMKKTLWCMASAMLLTTLPVLAQSNNNADGVVKIDRHATREYREGEMIVKFKESAPVRVKAMGKKMTSGVNQVDQVFNELGITAGEQLMPLTGEVQAKRTKALKSVTGQVIEDADMTRLYRLQFDAKKVGVYQAIEKLQALDEVEYAEPNYVVYALSAGSNVAATDKLDDPLCDEQWGNGQLMLNFLWKQKPITDKRPVIAILDTGVDIEHPDLKDNVWTNVAELEGAEGEDDDNNGFADDLHGYDFVNNTARLGDWNGHGTHCAGIAAAVGDNKIGITGANPYALIMPITVMQSDGTGDVATIIKGIDYAAANGADVISMSIGGYRYSVAEEQALAKAYATAVLVAAAGNDNKCIYAHDCPVNEKNAMQNGPMFPAAFTFVLGVEASKKDGGLASFSNFDEDGPVFSLYNEEQLYNYELRAPGAQIMSTFPGGQYKKLNGTSMACPYIAGGISRLLQVKEYGNWEILFGDLIHARKHRCEHEHDENVDFEAVYKITDKDRQPTLSLVTYTLNDAEEGDGDGKPDAGETIAFYPTLRNEWGQAENIRFSLELAEAEDPTIVEFLNNNVDFGKELSSYGKNVSATPIRIKVNPDCADGRKICMVFRATCDNITEEFVQEFILTAENGVELGGIISENTILYPNVHYIVTKTLAVEEGTLLTILPGTVLKFKKGVELNIPKGSLHCEGEPGNMIVFTMADNETGEMGDIYLNGNTVKYVKFLGLRNNQYAFSYLNMDNCIVENCQSHWALFATYTPTINQTNLIYSKTSNESLFSKSANLNNSNLIGNIVNDRESGYRENWGISKYSSSNAFGNIGKHSGEYTNIGYYSETPKNYTPESPNYLGSAREDIIRKGLWDINHPTYNIGYGSYNLSNTLTRPSAEAHGIVWKVVVNGFDAQDEFELLPPLGVGKHKFEVYFNRPMNKEAVPFIAMGVRSPYTSHTIAEDGQWNEEGTIYTAYLTITGKTGADGLNRIYVSGAEDDEYFEIPIENTRFNVQVAAAGSMATGLMAEAGLGKVSLTWETDEEDFDDLLGYNIMRYTDHVDSTYVVNYNKYGDFNQHLEVTGDTTIINSTVIESDETAFVDYDVVPGTTYYYVIKQLTTSLTSHALSNAVAATPLTAQKGDANGSMSVDIADVVSEVAYITFQDPQPFIFEAADVNSDEEVDILDVVGTLGIIINPAQAGVSSMDDTPVNYFMKEGVLYVENTQPLGGVQVRLHAQKGVEFTVMDGLDGMEQTCVWTADDEFLLLAYSMSGHTIMPGTHALLKMGDEAVVTQIVLSDAKGGNVTAVNGTTTGIDEVKAGALNIPTPNPFTTYLNVPYVVGLSGDHEVDLKFCDLSGRVVDAYSTIASQGKHNYTWQPRALQKGLYMVALYVDGQLVQSAKVICAGK